MVFCTVRAIPDRAEDDDELMSDESDDSGAGASPKPKQETMSVHDAPPRTRKPGSQRDSVVIRPDLNRLDSHSPLSLTRKRALERAEIRRIRTY